MGAERLTTLTAVKDWLGITNSDSDAGLQRIIDAASRFTLNWLGRPTLLRATYTQQFSGNGKNAVMLTNWPVLSVTSVDIGSAAIAASTFGSSGQSSGWFLSPDKPGYRMLEVAGYYFYRGVGSQIVYTSGFEASESDEVPTTPFELTPTTGGIFTVDRGVTIDGVAATEVASSPTAGHYMVSAAGKYTFASADAGKLAVMTYGYVPYDIAFAVTEMVGEWYKRSDNIGVLSKSLNAGVGESVTFNKQALTDGIASSLQPYRNVVPV